MPYIEETKNQSVGISYNFLRCQRPLLYMRRSFYRYIYTMVYVHVDLDLDLHRPTILPILR